MTAPPDDRGQLDFLQHVQRIFDEGEFVATYKFALLIALVELAIERGDDEGGAGARQEAGRGLRRLRHFDVAFNVEQDLAAIPGARLAQLPGPAGVGREAEFSEE